MSIVPCGVDGSQEQGSFIIMENSRPVNSPSIDSLLKSKSSILNFYQQ